jgi:high-affinity nickel-transport protein
LGGLNFGTLGYIVVGAFVVTWALAYTVWRTRRIEERWSVRERS